MTDKLYNLLPAVYRKRDAEQGYVLKALMAVIETEFDRLEADIDALYDDWFIETCADWVVPYIGSLLGVEGIDTRAYDLRAFIANTLAYRRRKGTAATIEEVANDVTEFPGARAVEFFQYIAATQHLDAPRPQNTTIDLKSMAWRGQDLVDPSPDETIVRREPLAVTAFDKTARTVGLHTTAPFNLSEIGIFLWRLQAYSYTGVSPAPLGDNIYSFDPTGEVIPLFNLPNPEIDVTKIAAPHQVPAPLSRRALMADLAKDTPEYFDVSPPLAVQTRATDNDLWQTVAIEDLRICDLSNFASGNPQASADPAQVAVDPVTGRLALHPTSTVQVRVNYGAGFPADVGAGTYNRSASIATWYDPVERLPDFVYVVAKTLDDDEIELLPGVVAGDVPHFTRLADAGDQWNSDRQTKTNAFGIIIMADSASYPEETPLMRVSDGQKLAIVAAGYTNLQVYEGAYYLALSPVDRRPFIDDEILRFEGIGGGEVVVDGLLIRGQIIVQHGALDSCTIRHCTLIPQAGVTNADGEVLVFTSEDDDLRNHNLDMHIYGSIVGGVRCTISRDYERSRASFHIERSILDHQGGEAIFCPVSSVDVKECTVLGSVSVRDLSADDTLFTDPVQVVRQQVGCLRYCYVPLSSRVPRRFRCQPEIAIQACAAAQGVPSLPLPQQERIQRSVQPQFVSDKFGNPAYGQLSRRTAQVITQGGENQAEIGVYNHLMSPQREMNLKAALREYVPFGLNTNIFYVS